MRRSLLVVVGAAAVGAVAVVTIVLTSSSGPEPSAQPRAQALRLALIDSIAAGEELEELATEPTGPPRKARPSALHFTPPGSVRRATLSAAATQPAFGQPTIAGIGGVGFEVDIRLDPSSASRIYMSAPGSLSSDTSWIWRSLDGGNTFKFVPAGAPLTGKAPACAGGGDTELAVDPIGRLYFNDLTLANFSTGRSDDQGVSFTCSNTGVPTTLVDRQWYATDGDPLAGGSVYLTSNEVGQGSVICGNSVGNNVLVMFRSPVPGGAAAAGIQYGPPYKITPELSCDEGIMGNNEVSPVATKTGKIVNGQPTTLATAVKHIYVVHDDATFSKIAIGRCFPVAFGAVATPNVSDPSGLNCDDLPVADLGNPSQVRTGFNFPALAIDKKGNLYAVWQQAPVVAGQPGNTSLMYSYSTNEGNTWSAPVQIPTPGLLNNVFTWAAAGDDGRVDIAWYGTPAQANPTASCGGADTVNGPWSVYLTQTLNGHDPAPTFTAPILVGEHYVHKGSMWTVMGGQCGSRALGDFLQLRIGKQGEAQVSYADSNNITSFFGTHAMYARQIGGTGLFANKTVSGPGILLGSAKDRSGDGIYEAGGQTSPNMPNLDILNSSLTVPLPANCRPGGTPCLRVTMKVSNLTLAPPALPDTDDDLVWLTQWLLPADPNCASSAASCTNGGRNLIVYAESTDGAAIKCFSGENAVQVLGGGVILTYPGSKEITGHACRAVMGPNGTIAIDVPLADVSLDPGVAPLDSKLYSVTASTMTLPAPANSVPSLGGIGGVFFNLIDVVRGYDVVMP